MNVLLYTAVFAPSVGGVESSVRTLAGQLAGAGAAVTVVTPMPAGAAADAGLPFPVVRRPGLGRLWRLVRGADVVHLAGPALVPMLMAWLGRRPAVIRHHAYQAACPNGLLFHVPSGRACPGHFLARRYGRCLGCAGAEFGPVRGAIRVLLTFPRRWLAARAAGNLHNARRPGERLALPRSAVVYQAVTAAAAPPQPDAGGAPRFAYVGRLVREKGLHLLVAAAARLRAEGLDVRVDMIGDGPMRPALERQVAAAGLGGRVAFLGFLDGARVPEAVGSGTALVMPSIWEETAGLAAVEHMVRGGLVIAADTGGLGELVGDAGLTFPPGDVGQLAACMRRTLCEPGLAERLGPRARARALALCGPAAALRAHLDAFERAVAGGA